MPVLKWWKWATILLMLYVIFMGLMGKVPRLPILNETIRNVYFHVPMWFGMILLLATSVWFSIQYTRTGELKYDLKANCFAEVGVVFGLLGLATGMIWAKYTWGDYWSGDPKQNGAAISMMIYFGYLVLRGSISGERDKARISSVYNIFAFAILIPLIYVLPRLTDSLHPGSGGNGTFSDIDLDSDLRIVFYPAVLAWSSLGFWICELHIRYKKIIIKGLENV